jgi:hypothetical protein
MFKPFYAVLIGAVLGFSMGAPVNALMNESTINGCQSKTDTHKIVSFRGFFGTTIGCVDRRYL